jgi:CRP-like cAMP-binding protein
MPDQSNLFLSALSPGSRDLLVSRSTAIPLPLRTTLYEVNGTPSYAYFMTSGVASIVVTMVDGETSEIGFIGREGIVGAFHLLGPALIPSSCFIQIEGAGLRIPLTDLRAFFNSSPEIRDRILECVQDQSYNLAQIAACNRLHEAEERLARWLLMAQDRNQSDILNITQEFLAEMLGSRRTTVTMVAGALQRSGLIEYRRGQVKIIDRKGLEEVACDCYKVTKRLYKNIYRRSQSATRN